MSTGEKERQEWQRRTPVHHSGQYAPEDRWLPIYRLYQSRWSPCFLHLKKILKHKAE